ncbi:cbb3-type cytochrome oxidase assembly protein CcoS [Limnovirga soli]|jgi:cbb3-type cytochrome oxidase maturation protein|uniref:Cbb3-type cytochrome oxidase assembly protein CcoS n=1 Tax=Limnovirga soli TaxID=2656915 RepID=A0A8J8JSB8_9BACT|nr:cbb3-type cytochrome oxidase assembly protein CcoS [Limnovirga soli]NNV53900.1 cbb3-type cytochrome oxidase assembly protein CcoS [Limnovirga soli]
MSVLIILLIASITVASIFLFAFLWSVKHGQFDDEISPPYRMLFDDMVPVEATEKIAIATTVEKTETSNQ